MEFLLDVCVTDKSKNKEIAIEWEEQDGRELSWHETRKENIFLFVISPSHKNCSIATNTPHNKVKESWRRRELQQPF